MARAEAKKEKCRRPERRAKVREINRLKMPLAAKEASFHRQTMPIATNSLAIRSLASSLASPRLLEEAKLVVATVVPVTPEDSPGAHLRKVVLAAAVASRLSKAPMHSSASSKPETR